jgi:hypothetical protein
MEKFIRYQDRHNLFLECRACGALITFAASSARPDEIEQSKAEHICSSAICMDLWLAFPKAAA